MPLLKHLSDYNEKKALHCLLLGDKKKEKRRKKGYCMEKGRGVPVSVAGAQLQQM